MNRAPFHLLQHVNSAPSSLDMMLSDDDSTSRDSGVSMTMDESTQVNFSSLKMSFEPMAVGERSTQSEKMSPLSRNAGSVQKSVPLRREGSCRIKLFNDNEEAQHPSPDDLTMPPLFPKPTKTPQPFNRKRAREESDQAILDFYLEEERPFKMCQLSPEEEEEYFAAEEMEVDDGEAVQDARNAEAQREELVQVIFNDVKKQHDLFAKPRIQPRGKQKSLTYLRSSQEPLVGMEEEEGLEFENNEANIHDKFHLTVDYHLEAVKVTNSTCFRRIGSDNLKRLLLSHTDVSFNAKYILIDCRYPFEYNGGHIMHAINFYDSDKIAKLFYEDGAPKHNRIPIFYCEFSQKRGPSMAHALRHLDRKINETVYPKVSFPEMYVLDAGYKEFHNVVRSNKKALCVPDRYIPMCDVRFAEELKLYPFHNKGKVPGQSVFRVKSAPGGIASSRRKSRHPSKKPTTIAEEGPMSPENGPAPSNAQLTTTPAPRGGLARLMSRKNLFGADTESPTSENFQLSIREQQQQQQPQQQQNDTEEDEVLGREMGHLVVNENTPPTPASRLPFDSPSP